MQNIADYLSLRSVKEQIGIEIEFEGLNLPTRVVNDTWRTAEDGSLRGESKEYVLSRPVNLSNVKAVLKDLDDTFKIKGCRINKDQHRAGIHVHINVQELTPRQVMTFACTYFLVEELLVNWCDKSRRGNHFCLRAKDAEFLILHIQEALSRNDLRHFYTDEIRYSALNFKSMFAHGSLEFRALESTTDWGKIYTWCEMLKQIKDESLKHRDPIEFIGDMKGVGHKYWFNNTFKHNAPLLMVSDFEEYMKRGIRIIEDIAYSHNWNSVNLNIFKKTTAHF
jgi:hypothetical protein